MNRMSAAAKLLFLFSLTSLIFLFSCKQAGNPAGDGEGTVSPQELYSEMLGTWIGDKEYIRGEKSILILDEDECAFEIAEYRGGADFKVPEEITSLENALSGGKEMMKRFLGGKTEFGEFSSTDVCFYLFKPGYQDFYQEILLCLKLVDSKIHLVYYKLPQGSPEDDKECIYFYSTYSREDSGSGSGEEPDITEGELTGSYTISEANGSQFTFGDSGTWTYNYNGRTNEGTWSLEGGKVTIEYSNGGITAKAVFAVSVSGDTYTLKGESGDYVTVISSAFMVTDGSAVSDGVVTLVKN